MEMIEYFLVQMIKPLWYGAMTKNPVKVCLKDTKKEFSV